MISGIFVNLFLFKERVLSSVRFIIGAGSSEIF